MTREEAIARIKEHKIIHKMNEPRAIYISEALDMAIKALEQEPCDKCVYSTKDGYCQYDDITEAIPPFETCEDAISRQEVLNILFYKSDNNSEVRLSKELRDRIKALPPVTPQTKTDVLDKIKAEIEQLPITDTAIRLVADIIDKYKTESEE